MKITDLKPKAIWTIFDEITQVPRPSKKEEKIRQYLKDWAVKNGVDVKEDETGNILMSKPATPGCEAAPVLTMQAHMDMVCEKNSGVEFNFDTDSIKTVVDGDWVRAEGTTLGADNGIGMAGAMAALVDENLKHGPLEALFTVDEETGLTGAFALKEGFMKGKYLLNLDSEDEGEVFVGCAGGVDTISTLPYTTEKVPEGYHFIKIYVEGLRGGHSGCDIHLGLGNSIKILSRFLAKWIRKNPLYLVSFEGGNLRNAIPREASAVIAVRKEDKEPVTIALNMFASEVAAELKGVDDNFKMRWETTDDADAIESKTATNLINALNACIQGVVAMSRDLEGLVETSTNLASVKMPGDNKIVISTSQRSSVESAKHATAFSVESVFTLAGATVTHSEGYPGWKPKMDSHILQLTVDTYEQLFGEKPAIKAIHAGLECGLFLEKYPYLDMVSFGPTLRGVHSPDEKMHIPAVANFYKHLVAIIEKVAEEK
ncbi:MAG: aminoacyl-histidine dipeptidase [Bacteroidales bacterium]|nr:aminoacyl-histidine dipeptidase [Bacteroidales bacterium]